MSVAELNGASHVYGCPCQLCDDVARSGVTNEMPRKSTAELFAELCEPLFPPRLSDLRRRIAEDAKRNGASEKVIAGILAVVLEATR